MHNHELASLAIRASLSEPPLRLCCLCIYMYGMHSEEGQDDGSQSRWAGTPERGGAVAVNRGGRVLGGEARPLYDLSNYN